MSIALRSAAALPVQIGFTTPLYGTSLDFTMGCTAAVQVRVTN